MSSSKVDEHDDDEDSSDGTQTTSTRVPTLGNLSDTRGEIDSKMEEIHNAVCEVRFTLPNGARDSATFKVGQTVEVLKSYIAAHHDISMADQRLYLSGNLMIDPLSLSDFPAILERLEADVDVRYAHEK